MICSGSISLKQNQGEKGRISEEEKKNTKRILCVNLLDTFIFNHKSADASSFITVYMTVETSNDHQSTKKRRSFTLHSRNKIMHV